jgi:hypothetical protein
MTLKDVNWHTFSLVPNDATLHETQYLCFKLCYLWTANVFKSSLDWS